jgi:hypothetical protein
LTHPAYQLFFDLVEFLAHTFSNGDSLQSELSIVATSGAQMRKSQKVKTFGFTLPSFVAIGFGEPPELDQACLFGMQGERKAGRCLPEEAISPPLVHHPFMIDRVEEPLYIRIEYPTDFTLCDRNIQRVQRIVLLPSGTELPHYYDCI